MQRAKGIRLWVEKRKGRPPVYFIRDGSRKISTGCTGDDIDGANEELAKYIAKTFRPNTKERDLARISCAEVLALYAKDIAPALPSVKTIGYHMKALGPFWGEKMLDAVKGSTCRAYVEQRPVKASTARQELKTFQAAINHWHRESPLAAVPRVTLPPPGARRERVLERKEVAQMLRATRKLKLPHVARFIILGIYTGTRHNAILSLRRVPGLVGGHVDLERGVIYRRGSAERETSKRRPPVPVTPRLGAHLARWLRKDVALSTQHIIHHQGVGLLKMKRAWASVVKEAGLGKDVTPHVLRHTCASWLLWEGQTIWDVAGVIGADASTVERVYGHHRRIDAAERKRA